MRTVRAFFGAVFRALARFTATRYAFHIVLCVLVFMPHAFGTPHNDTWLKLGPPRVQSGDEPHYMVYLSSLIKDFDLDVSNNYLSSHRGGYDAGEVWKGGPLDHHSIWFVGEHRQIWYLIYESEGPKWKRDEAGQLYPTPREGADPNFFATAELPWNAPGLPILIAPLCFPFRNTNYVECVAVFISGLMLVFGSMFWRMLARSLTDDQRTINIGILFAFLGTPLWHYGRSFFTEAHLACVMTGALAYAIVKKNYWASGFLMGLAIFLKPVEAIAGLPLGLMLLWQKRWFDAGKYLAGVVFWILMTFVLNQVLYGDWSKSSNAWSWGFPLGNTLHILFNPTRGLWATAPILFVAAFGWRAVLRRNRELAGALAAFLALFVMNACYFSWSGGWCYSIRFLVPAMPLFALGVIPHLDTKEAREKLVGFIALVGAISVMINGLGAAQYWKMFAHHPIPKQIDQSEARDLDY